MVLIYLASFVFSILLSFVITRQVRNSAVNRGWVAAPSPHHIHGSPIPRLGGVAIFVSFVAVSGMLLAVSSLSHIDIGLAPRTLVYIILSGTLVFALGLYDDCRSLNPYVKFATQSAAALLLFVGGFRILQLGSHNLEWLSLPLTIIWVILITNAFNLIDGLDGLAAGSALFSTLTVFVVSLSGGTQLVSLLTVVLAGSILGFLRFNFNPATIFLGDSGSLFIGFMLSALALAGSKKSPTAVAVAIPVVSFGLPVMETMLSVFRRFLSGQPLFVADREHIHHRLLKLGLSQRKAVVILYGVSALCGLLSLFLLHPGGASVGIVLFVVGVGIWIGVQHLGYQEFLELRRAAQRTIEQKKMIMNNLAIHRAVERLERAEDYLELCLVLQEAFENNDFDAFQLNISSCSDGYSIANELEIMNQDSGCVRSFAWHKPSGEFDEKGDRERVPAWSLTLELITSQRRKCGFFSLIRYYAHRPFVVDVDVLISAFQQSLANAVDRLTNSGKPYPEELFAEVHTGIAGAADPDIFAGKQPTFSS